MTWYGKTTKQLDLLLESKPKLSQLLALNDFYSELKSYNTKLLDYISNTPALIAQAVGYLTQAPLMTDSNDRKFKFPQQTVEMVQTETTCILNGFFKESDGRINFDLMMGMLECNEILPLLAGYFFRANLCLLNNKYKDTVDRVYSNPKVFTNLINHSDNMAISNTIQLFLNLDINKNVTSQPDKLTNKLDVIRSIFQRMRDQGRKKGPDSAAIVQNLCSVLIETVDKYYLIVDGKQMIEVITSQPCVQIMVELINQQNEIAFPAFGFFIALINYYSFSSFNAQDDKTSADTIRKNAERLESEPMIEAVIIMFPSALERIAVTPKMDLYHYKLLQMLCHCISISSTRILSKISELRFFGLLIDLLFKHENNNILHMLIEKSFYHIFTSQRKIYQEYKWHLFCELDIIEVTTARMLKMFPQNGFMQQAKKKAYIGHFMRILKIYSNIQPTNQNIIAAIKAKTTTWNKISELLIKPYEAICFKQIGTYDNVPTPLTQQFAIQQSNTVTVQPAPQNTSAIEQIQKEQLYPPRSPTQKKSQEKQDSTLHTYQFDNEPAHLQMVDHISTSKEKQLSLPQLDNTKSLSSPAPSVNTSVEMKKSDSYQEYLLKQKAVAGQDIKNKRRSLSQDRKLNSSRGKMTSPSPNKSNKWDKKEEKQDKSEANSKEHPSIPKGARRNVGPSTYSIPDQRQNRWVQQEPQQPSVSKSVNMQDVKRIKVIQIDVPKQKKYRRTDEKDKVLLQFLGITM